MKAYEILNPSFSDLSLDQQIEHGINDWVVEHNGEYEPLSDALATLLLDIGE